VTRIVSAAPNPFLGSTTVTFSLREEGPVAVRVYGVGGRLVRTLLEASLGAGDQSVTWDGRDESGRLAAAGAYVVTLHTNGGMRSQRVVRLQ
jgi:flagellar hook assembly protein FlgD